VSRHAIRFFAVALVTFALDQLSKYYLLSVVGMPHRPPIVISEYFSLVMAWNKGISFSMLANNHVAMPYVLAAMAAIISAILVRFGLKAARRIEWVGYAMVVGGALGNALDRLRFGAVADFFYAHIGDLGWPAFNIADSAIFLGVCLLLYSMVKPAPRA
jgi:signal peptidase II